MEEFLHDYGLVWVGTQTDAQHQPIDIQENSTWNTGSSVKNPDTLEKIVKNIGLLNLGIGAGEAKVIRDPNDPKLAYLKEQDAISLTLYADGISLCEGPFRPFTQHETLQFVQDILDGFFPSELESLHPDGVAFKLIDKRQIEFLKTRRLVPKAQKLGGCGKSSCLIDLPSTETTTKNGHDGHFKTDTSNISHKLAEHSTSEPDEIQSR
ncbi:unnamed protein product [Echinostoma caproni]|uniref:UBX domain-containing protein 11 n=1 Tax=Echinostoma caproni TaxID=27848 RepID=A0A183B4P0_9TREM|nr:unnamed protein product [Echinostoma caproni]